jgi:uncharacterized integral membrane protein (TIGR00698 family)
LRVRFERPGSTLSAMEAVAHEVQESKRGSLGQFLMPAAAALCLFPFVSAELGLLLGLVLALAFGNPYLDKMRKATHTLLALSVVGLGAGMDLRVVARVGAHGVLYTVLGIVTALALGALLTRLLRVSRDVGTLITVGTAICGGSAIAAVVPVLRPKQHEVSVALAIVFLLNAIALFVFPPIGHAVGLTDAQFGLWSALAIHDTSSVVGAAVAWGGAAVAIATTVKLARALWIVPLTIAIGHWHHRTNGATAKGKPARPWFIAGFIAAAALATYIPGLQHAGHLVATASKQALVLTLFFIGASLTRSSIRSVGARPLALGLALWVATAGLSLAAIAGHLIAPP